MSIEGSNEAQKSISLLQVGAGLAGLVQIGAGITLTVVSGGGLAVGGSVLISTGLNGFMYVIRDPQDEFNSWEYFKESACGIPTGLLSGGIGEFSKGISVAAKFGLQMFGGATSVPLAEVANTYSRTGELPSRETLKTKVITGAVSGLAAGCIGTAAGKFANSAVDAADDMTAILYRALQGGIEGSATGATCQMIFNVFDEIPEGENRDLWKGVIKSSMIGGSLGAATAATSQWKILLAQKGLLVERHDKLLEKQSALLDKQIRYAKDILSFETDPQLVEIATEKYARTSQKIDDGFRELSLLRGAIGGPQERVLSEQIRKLLEKQFALLDKKIQYAKDILSFETDPQVVEKAKEKVARTSQKLTDGFRELSRLTGILLTNSASTTLSQGFLVPKNIGERALENLTKALQPEPVVTFSTCDPDELFSHVVLVQAINDDQYFHGTGNDELRGKFGLTNDFPWGEIDKPEHREFRSKFALLGILSPKGEIGHHINFERKQFDKILITRPTVHWSWNQLVQPNSGGNWEDAQIAVLQPFDDFESSEKGKPFNLAPYDTFTIGTQTLKNQAIVLIPNSLENEVEDLRQHYKASSVQFVTYNAKQPLRDAIMDQLERDSNVWGMCDDKGTLIGRKAKMTDGGYEKTTCIKKSTGEVIRLLEGANTKMGDSLNVKGRTVDLHDNQTHTLFRCDESGNAYFEALNRFKHDNKSVVKSPFFAANIDGNDREALKKMGTLCVLECYNALKEHDPATNCHNLADYLIAEAIYADIVSLFFKNDPLRELLFSKFDYKLMIETKLPYLLNCLQNISNNHLNDEDASGLFKNYTSLLTATMEECDTAKDEARRIIKEPAKRALLQQIPPYIFVGNDEWEQVSLPKGAVSENEPEKLAFHLDRNWPLSEKLNAYMGKILCVLPHDIEDLQALYQCLAPTEEISKENYRKHVICGFIFALIQEQCFLKNQFDASSSILTHRTSNYGDELFADYGLVCSDHSDKKTIGNSLFDNIAVQLNLSIDSRQLRTDLCGFMRKIPIFQHMLDRKDGYLLMGDGSTKFYYNSWDSYLEQMSWDLTWATEIEIAAIANMLDHPIFLMDRNSSPKFYNEESQNEPFLLYRKNGGHFGSLFPVKGLSIQEIVKLIKLEEQIKSAQISHGVSTFPQNVTDHLEKIPAINSPHLMDNLISILEKKAGNFSEKDIAQYLWLNPDTQISDDTIYNVNAAALYLKDQGFALMGIKADGNCFFNAFLKSYETLSRKIPILDNQKNKLSYLRDLTATAKGSIDIDRAEAIKTDGNWVTASDEGDLLAIILKIPIRVVTVNGGQGDSGISDMLTFPDSDTARQNWDTILELDKPKEYILIVDLGGHFIYAKPIATIGGGKDKNCQDILKIQINDQKLTSQISHNPTQEIFNIINNPASTADDLITSLSQNTKLAAYYAKPIGVFKEYTVGEHTTMVLQLALRYRNCLSPQVTPLITYEEFLFFLALHDMGKGIAWEMRHTLTTPIKQLELIESRKILNEIMENLEIPSCKKKILSALLMYDSQGDYLQFSIDADLLLSHVREMAKESDTDPLDFYELYRAFHLVDAASHPGLMNAGFFRLEEATETIHYCEGYEMLIDSFKDTVLRNNL